MGDACSNPRRYAPPENRPGLRPAKPAPRAHRSAVGLLCYRPHRPPRGLLCYRPRLWMGLCYHPRFAVDGLVLSPTRQLCYHPQGSKKTPIQINRLRHLSRRVTRARGFLTYKVFNVLRHKAAPPLRGQAPCRLLRAASGPPPAPSALPARHTPAPAVAVAISGSLRSQGD